MAHSEAFSAYALDLKSVMEMPGQATILGVWTSVGRRKTIRLRGLHLRSQTAQEAQLAARREALRDTERMREVHLREYLQHTYPCKVSSVHVEADHVEIAGQVAQERQGLFLVEAPLYADITSKGAFPTPSRSLLTRTAVSKCAWSDDAKRTRETTTACCRGGRSA